MSQMINNNVPHGLMFIKSDGTSIHTWNDWKLVPTSRPLFSTPSVKTVQMSIPGSDGILDLTESLTGEIHYENRKGNIEFQVQNKDRWHVVYSNILDFLHGAQMKVILDDDPSYYYVGRFNVNSWKSQKNKSLIVIEYNVEPYKMERFSSLEDWQWDSFDFEDGIIRDYRNIDVFGTLEFQIECRRKSVVPSFLVSADVSGLSVIFDGVSYPLPNGTSRVININLKEGVNTLTFVGTGLVSIDYRGGRL